MVSLIHIKITIHKILEYISPTKHKITILWTNIINYRMDDNKLAGTLALVKTVVVTG